MDELFPVVDVESIPSLGDEELDSLISQYETVFGSIATGTAFEDMETPPDLNERKALAKEGAETLKALRDAKKERTEERERYEAEMAEIAADAGVVMEAAAPEAEAEGEGGEEEGEGEAEGEPEAEGAEEPVAEGEAEVEEPEPEKALVASAQRPYRHAPPRGPKKHEPVAMDADIIPLRASVGLDGYSPGEILDRDGLARATMQMLRTFVSTPAGFSMKQTLASANWGDLYPEERKLGEQLEFDKIHSVRGPEALTAAGGWCAPSTIRYDIGALGVTERPVRDALTAFNATRGGIQYIPDISIAETDVSGGITHMTEVEDEGGTMTKDCVVVECPEFSDVRADIIAACLQAGNLASIAFPELIAAWQDLLAVLAARTRESLLLDALKNDAQTTNVTETAQAYGALDGLVYTLLRLAAGFRSRHRLSASAVLRSLAPAWLADVIVADDSAKQFITAVHSGGRRWQRRFSGAPTSTSSSIWTPHRMAVRSWAHRPRPTSSTSRTSPRSSSIQRVAHCSSTRAS